MPATTSTGLDSILRTMWLAQNTDDVRQVRIQRMRVIGCVTLLLLGMGWGAFFAYKHMWALAGFFFALMPSAWAVGVLAARGKDTAANLIMFGVGILAVMVFTLLLDAPTAQNQRSIHLFLLPLAVAAFLTFGEERRTLSYGIVALCLACFIGLMGSSWDPWPELTLPDSIRAIGKWINGLTAGASLYLVLHILHSDATQNTTLDHELNLALKEKQFVLYFQPQLNQQHRVTGAEVLIRWRHPQRGILPPGVFIDQAERNGLMVPLGQWILEQACSQIRQWRNDPLLKDMELAVNVSQMQFRQSDFAANVLSAVNRYGIPPHQLELELTETMMVLDMQDLQTKIALLQGEGLRFSLDDFGTGFSSLSHLRQLPLHTLKIDRSFIKDLPDDSNSKSIVRSLLTLAESMKLTMVAEGIETPSQYEFLAQHGCPKFQGFLFSKPLPLDEFVAFVHKHNRRDTQRMQSVEEELEMV